MPIERYLISGVKNPPLSESANPNWYWFIGKVKWLNEDGRVTWERVARPLKILSGSIEFEGMAYSILRFDGLWYGPIPFPTGIPEGFGGDYVSMDVSKVDKELMAGEWLFTPKFTVIDHDEPGYPLEL